MDSSYGFSKMVSAGLGLAANDAHEFTVLEDGTALTTISNQLNMTYQATDLIKLYV
jgi:hypothetical protein